MSPPEALAIRSLASLLRSGMTVRRALAAWPAEIPAPLREAAVEVRRRLALGGSIRCSMSALPASLADLIAPILAVHLATGDDVAAALDRAADMVEEEAAFGREARAASSGARLSARLVAGLPLAFVPFSPATHDALADGAGLAMLVCGAVACAGGLRWIGRLVPNPPVSDPAIRFCRTTAALLRAGLPLDDALAAIAAHPPAGLEAALGVASARVRLGQPWTIALCGGDARLRAIATVIDRARRMGSPVAAALEELASVLDRHGRSAHTARLRRAPVLMVVPLTCCILPAYGLLAIGPFLLGALN